MKRTFFLLFFSALFCSSIAQNLLSKPGSVFFNQIIPGDSAVLFARGVVSYPFMNHSSVTISKNMDEMYWSKWYDKEGREEIVYSEKINGKWTTPEKVSFSGIYSDDVPFLSPDGSKLYFVSRRPLHAGSTSKKENIWYVERIKGGNWSEPQPVSAVINSKQLHWQISVSQNQNIYFSTDEGIKLSRFINGEYQSPILITEALNPLYQGGHPFISPDESYILFATGKLDDNFGKNDLYIGFKNNDGKWCDPINLGDKINGIKGDMCPVISPDERFLFFVKHDNVFNIYWVKANFLQEMI